MKSIFVIIKKILITYVYIVVYGGISLFLLTIVLLPLYLYFYEIDSWTVHPDEIEIRDWVYSVNGSIDSRYMPERHIGRVYLKNCNITNDDLIRLVPLSDLRELDLSNTDITDDAIPTIVRMESLRRLTIKDTIMTREGVKRMYNEREMSIEVTFREE